MSTVTSILGTDIISASRSVINTNFGNLNTDKVETSVLSGSYFTASTVSANFAPVTSLGSTANINTCPTATGTQTITHGLGRVPIIIRLYGIGQFEANAAATPTPFSIGIWNASGNMIVYMDSDNTTSRVGQAANTYSIFLNWSGTGNFIFGNVTNVGATTFDISWTEVGTVSAMPFMWEAQ